MYAGKLMSKHLWYGISLAYAFLIALTVSACAGPGNAQGVSAPIGPTTYSASQPNPESSRLSPCVLRNISLGFTPSGMTLDPGTNRLFVSDGYSRIWSFNGSTLAVIHVWGNLASPTGLSFGSETGGLYAADLLGSTVSVINGTSNLLAASIPVPAEPSYVVYDTTTHRLFVSSIGDVYEEHGYVSMIDPQTNTVLRSVQVGASPYGMAFNPSTGTVYVANADSNNVTIINGTSGAIEGSIPVGAYPTLVAFDSESGSIYVADAGANVISVIDAKTNVVAGTIADSSGYGIRGLTTDPKSGELLVLNQEGLAEIDPLNGALRVSLDLNHPWVGVLDAAEGLYYVGGESENLFVVSLSGTCSTPPGPGLLGLPDDEGLMVIGSVVTVALATAVVAIWRRGRRKRKARERVK